MTSSGLTSIVVVAITAGLGEHKLEISPSEQKLIGLVSFTFLDPASR